MPKFHRTEYAKTRSGESIRLERRLMAEDFYPSNVCTDPDFHREATPSQLFENGLAMGEALTDPEGKKDIVRAFNANAIDSALQRQAILQASIEAYAIVIAAFDVFSTVYNSIPLEGTDKVDVPYFPLQTNAAVSFDKTAGYTTARDWAQQKREVWVGGDGDTTTSGANAAANTARDRKYIMINYSSADIARNPYLNSVKLFQQAVNKLGVDIFKEIVSRIITTANFGASALSIGAVALSADNIADLREACTGANWPLAGRSLVLDHTYYTPLLKDPSFKQYLSSGTTDPLWGGRIQNAYGFDNIVEVPSLSSYSPAGEYLRGWVNHKSAALVVTAPILPSEEVRKLLTMCHVAVDPKTGIAITFRSFGNATLDTSGIVAEASYGAAVGVAAALGRITSQ